METLQFKCTRCRVPFPRTAEFFPRLGQGIALADYCRNCRLPGANTTHKRRRNAGLCINCEGEPEPERLRCKSCADRHKRKRRAKRKRWVAEGRCQICGSKDVIKGKSCRKCRKRQNLGLAAKKVERLNQGLCSHCGLERPEAGKKQCGSCLDRKLQDYTDLREDVIAGYGAKCTCCGESNRYFLAIDHVNNNGAAERREMGGATMLRRIRKANFPPEYQLLCFNCNSAKGYFGSCPHTWPDGQRPPLRARLKGKVEVVTLNFE